MNAPRTRSRPRAEPAPRLRLSVQLAANGPGIPARSTLRRWTLRALRRDALLTLRFVGAAEGRRLNRDFRGRDYATNVLTFVYGEAPDAGARPALAGDIVLCLPVLRREAREQRRTLRAHCAHLVIHGVLHLQGYDHEQAEDAKVMETLETELLAALGYGDPYAPIERNTTRRR